MQRAIRIATRSSRLALWQATFVAAELRAMDPSVEVELVEVTTLGDQNRSQPLHEMGGVGVFTREVQRAVLDGRADVAVHSLKDLPTESADGLTLAAVPVRASRWDALVLPGFANAVADAAEFLSSLSADANVGTGSLRRQAQLIHAFPDVHIANIRGNVETRIQKLDAGEFAAIILAEAGLQRLEFGDRISARLMPPLVYPAVGQGALGIECRAEDVATRSALEALDDAATRSCVTAERAMLAKLQAGCHAPVGALAQCENGRLSMEAVVLSVDGTQRLHATANGFANDPATTGIQLADHLLQQGAAALMGA